MNIGASQGPFWELDENNLPRDEGHCLRMLQKLAQDPDWVTTDNATRYCRLLQDTQMPNSEVGREAQKIREALISRHNELFDVIQVKFQHLADVKKVPSFHLATISEVFKRRLELNTRESTDKLWNIVAPERTSADACEQFLRYVHQGQVTVTKENLFGLLDLALEYQITDLAASCISFINLHMTPGTQEGYPVFDRTNSALPDDLPMHHAFQAVRQLRAVSQPETGMFQREKQEKIKENLFLEATAHHYEKLALNLKNKTLIMTGMMHSDGVGDYYHITAAAEQIKKDFPDVKIKILVFTIAKEPPKGLKILDSSLFETQICHYSPVPQHLTDALTSADFVLEMSQETPSIKPLCKGLQERYRFIGEYGLSHPAMGVAKEDMGIFIKDVPKTTSLLDVKNPDLRKVLFGKQDPTPEDLVAYLKNHEPYVAYLKSGSLYQMAFLYTIIAYQDTSAKSSIDVFIPNVPLDALDRDFLRAHGIATIKVIDKDGEKVDVISEKGKELRLINLFPFDQTDFQTLFTQTNPLVGCTGDHSLSEALSYGRSAFYEIRPVKTTFWNEMIELAGFVGSEPHYLKQYFIELKNMYSPHQERMIYSSNKELSNFFKQLQPTLVANSVKIAEILRKPEFASEMEQFTTLMRSQFNFNKTLKAIASRQFALSQYPELQTFEAALKKDYMNGSKSLKEVSALHKQKVDSFI